jgi:hypothetical protein
MQKSTFLTAALIVAVIGTGAVIAHQQADAQAAPPPPPAGPMADAGRGGMMQMHPHEGWGGPMRAAMMAHRGPWGAHRGQPPAMGLIFPAADKNLSPADVQVIAQATLLRRGNHDWKVINVTANEDKTISFAYATADGGVIARFAVDPHSGRMRRVG